MLTACVNELRTHPEITNSWTELAYALGSQSAFEARMKYAKTPSRADLMVALFWKTFSSRFTWDLLPINFLHELYFQWMNTEHPDSPRAPLKKTAFTKQLKAVATPSGEWLYTRS